MRIRAEQRVEGGWGGGGLLLQFLCGIPCPPTEMAMPVNTRKRATNTMNVHTAKAR